MAQHNHADPHAQRGANAQAKQPAAMPKSAQVVFDTYVKIQAALAQDSMQEVSANAAAIAKSVHADPARILPGEIAKHADMLAKAGDIKAAREAFKMLSDSLIKYLTVSKAHPGHYVQVFCSMANARWLQTGTVISNPYFGKSMARCGKIEG